MDQNRILQKVRELFEDQGFDVKKENQTTLKVKNGQEMTLRAFSSELFTPAEIMQEITEDEKVFVDEDLNEIKDQVNNQVSVLKENEEVEDVDMPSFELIGDIAVVNDLDGRSEEDAVEAILSHHEVKTILLKTGKLSGEFRVGDYKALYGNETETIHKEHGHRFKVDPTKAYYSERFSTERKRVADQVEEGEKVLVMFAGVGPFAILCGEKADRVVAVEKNPEACGFLKENIRLNAMEDAVEARCGDVEQVVPGLDERFDRVIMPLPGSAEEYFETALGAIDTGTVHLYSFLEDDSTESLVQELETDRKNHNVEVTRMVPTGEKSPSVTRYCLDIEVSQ